MGILNDNAKVSIVMPVYNGESYLPDAIESIIAQSYSQWELIIVNDCSTDSSADIMRCYAAKDKRIHIVNNKCNLKLPKSLNVGFQIASGKYYTWTSHDNLLKTNMLERLVDELEHHSEYGMVYSNHEDIDENGNFICERILGEPKDMGVIGNVCGASFMYRRSVAETVGEYDPDMFLAEDYDYWLRVYSKTIIKHIPDNLYSCRRHRNSLTSTRAQQIQHQTLRAIMKNHWVLINKCTSSLERKQLFHMYYTYCNEDDEHLINVMINAAFRCRCEMAISRVTATIHRLIAKIKTYCTRLTKKFNIRLWFCS